MFCLIFRQAIDATHNVVNEDMAELPFINSSTELPFINSSTFAGYLYFKVAARLFRLDLLGSMLLCLLLRWYGTTLPNWALTSPMLGFLKCPPPSSKLCPLGSTVLTSHRSHTFAWVFVSNMPIKPWHFLSAPQLRLGSFLIGCHCCLEWIS